MFDVTELPDYEYRSQINCQSSASSDPLLAIGGIKGGECWAPESLYQQSSETGHSEICRVFETEIIGWETLRGVGRFQASGSVRKGRPTS